MSILLSSFQKQKPKNEIKIWPLRIRQGENGKIPYIIIKKEFCTLGMKPTETEDEETKKKPTTDRIK